MQELGKPLASLVLELAVGVAAGVLVERWGWARWMERVARPLLRAGRLPAELAAAFCAAMVSGPAAAGTLARFFDAGRLDEREVKLGIFLNTFPAQLRHIPSQCFPVAMLTSVKVAAAFFGVQMLAGVARTAGLLAVARRSADATDDRANEAAEDVSVATAGLQAETLSDVLKELPASGHGAQARRLSLPRQIWNTFRRVAVVTVPVCLAMMLFARTETFHSLQQQMDSLPLFSELGPQAPAVLAGSFASLSAAAGTAGDFLKKGFITERDAAVLLLWGSILSAPFRTLRHGAGSYVGVLGLKRGAAVASMAQGLRVVSMVIVTILVMLLWRPNA